MDIFSGRSAPQITGHNSAILTGEVSLGPKSKFMQPGRKFKRRGQTNLFATWRPHITRDGRCVPLAVLTSRCADCGEDFVTEGTKGMIRRGDLDRRCKRCRRVGRPAKNRKQTSRSSIPVAAGRRRRGRPSKLEKELIG